MPEMLCLISATFGKCLVKLVRLSSGSHSIEGHITLGVSDGGPSALVEDVDRTYHPQEIFLAASDTALAEHSKC